MASPAPTPAPASVTISVASTFPVGSYITGSWTKTSGASTNDWIGLYPASVSTPSGTPASTWWVYVTAGATSGTFTTSDTSETSAFTIPITGGPYVIYYFYSNGYTQLGKSISFDVLPVPTMAPVTLQCRPVGSTASNIKHIIVVITENHSFDAYFGAYCKAKNGSNPSCNTGPTCCEGAPYKVSGYKATNLTNAQNLAFDPNHSLNGEICEENGGKMDKYVTGCPSSSPQNFAVASGPGQMSIYWNYAKNYAIADRFFQSAAGASSQSDMYFARGAFEFQDNAYVPKSSKEAALCATNTIVLTDTNI
eukprot:gene3044-3735_t